ncbi:MAG TPA: ABC transporter ATP-binding protein [Bacillota bacterium]|nr:ABC transporter ATP-binding protein [Bacillota bacterium]
MKTKSMLQVKNLTKEIGKKRIIDNISFEVPQGEIFGLLGPNGAGKTTMIRMIVGLMRVTGGEILIHDHSVTSQFEQAMKYVGAIVENPELYKFLSGYQNLVHYARMIPGVTKQRIDDVISLVKLEDRIDDPVKTYSLGMRQRLGVAQAILHQPSLLILDEPTNGLDPSGIRELRDYLRHLAEVEGTTIIISSHLLSEIELICDRVGVIHHGRLMEVKVMKELAPMEKGGSQVVQFQVDQPTKGREALIKLDWNTTVRELPEGFEIDLTKEQVAELNAHLVAVGVRIYEIRCQRSSLEDRFLELTRGE